MKFVFGFKSAAPCGRWRAGELWFATGVGQRGHGSPLCGLTDCGMSPAPDPFNAYEMPALGSGCQAAICGKSDHGGHPCTVAIGQNT